MECPWLSIIKQLVKKKIFLVKIIEYIRMVEL